MNPSIKGGAAPIAIGISVLSLASLYPFAGPVHSQESGSVVRASQRHNLSVGIGKCPRAENDPPKDSKQERSVSLLPVEPVAVATSIATVVAGAAIESTVNYLTQERAFTSRGVAQLGPQDQNELFLNRKCLYVYLYTLDLWRFFNPDQQSPPREGAKPLPIDPSRADSPLASRRFLSSPSVLGEIDAKKLTNFMMVVSFEPAGVESVKVGKKDEGQITYAFYRPYLWKTIYPSFIDVNCPALRNCAKRDVALQLVLKFPVAPDPSKTESRAFALSKAYEGVRSESVGAALTGRYAQWFAVNENVPPLTNLEFSLVESSKPGALVRALGASMKENKESVVKVIVPQQ